MLKPDLTVLEMLEALVPEDEKNFTGMHYHLREVIEKVKEENMKHRSGTSKVASYWFDQGVCNGTLDTKAEIIENIMGMQ